MSRIDEALRRLTGAHRDTRIPAMLDRFAAEKGPKREEVRVKSFATPGPQRVETRPAAAPPVAERRVVVQAAAPAVQEPAAVESEPAQEDERLVDVRQLADYTGFVFGAIRRHALLVAGTFA